MFRAEKRELPGVFRAEMQELSGMLKVEKREVPAVFRAEMGQLPGLSRAEDLECHFFSAALRAAEYLVIVSPRMSLFSRRRSAPPRI